MWTSFSDLVNYVINIIASAIPVIISLALLAFLWGVARFIMHSSGGKEQDEAKNVMLWGIIALFLMVSIWGIIRLLQATFLP